MKIIGVNIPKNIRYIIEQLNNAGYEAYVVGGCVRDSLLGLNFLSLSIKAFISVIL